MLISKVNSEVKEVQIQFLRFKLETLAVGKLINKLCSIIMWLVALDDYNEGDSMIHSEDEMGEGKRRIDTVNSEFEGESQRLSDDEDEDNDKVEFGIPGFLRRNSSKNTQMLRRSTTKVRPGRLSFVSRLS